MKMKTFRWAAMTLALTLVPASASAQEFNDKQKSEIEQIVRDYLLEYPEILLDVSRLLEQRQEENEQKRRMAGVTENAEEIFRSPADYVAGNPNGDVTMVEFFDYNCSWCKKGMPEVMQLLEKDKGLRFVLKEFPIFGVDSEYAARAALAARKQGKYWDLHLAMLGNEGKIKKDDVDRIAQETGLDFDRLRKDMELPEIAETISRIQELAQRLGINGTPAFVIGSTVVPGYLPAEGLAEKIQDVRANGGCKVC